MDKYDITQQALAKEMGVHYVTLNLWLSKKLSAPHKEMIDAAINRLIEKQKG